MSTPDRTERACYTVQGSRQTLREGLVEYRARHPSLLAPAALPERAAELFRRHDAGHVVFGCDISVRGETLIDTWTVFGTTAGWRGYREYFRYPQVNQIFRETGYLRIALEFLRCLPDVLRVIRHSRRLAAKWPWSDYEKHLDRPLDEIRREFGIAVV